MALANITNNILTDSGVLVTGLTPTTRTLTINGTAYDLSADRSWSVGTHTGSLTTGYVPKATGSTSLTDGLLYDTGSAVLIGTQTAGSGKFMVYSTSPDNHYQAVGSAPSFRFADTITSPSYTGIVGLATASNHFIIGAAAGDMVLSNNTTSAIGNFLFGTGATERMRITPTGNVSIGGTGNTYKLDVTGTGRFSGQLRLESTITNGTYTYTLPGATGTIALTSDISGMITGSGTTNYLPKFTGTSTIGNSQITDDGTTVTASGNVYVGNTFRLTKSSSVDIQAYTGSAYSNLFYDAASHNWQTSGGTAKMVLNASGNLGLGVTPSAWGGSYKAVQIANSALWAATNDLHLTLNILYDGAYKYIDSGYATRYNQYLGQHIWYNAPSGTAGNAISFTQAMTLNASGNLSIGNTNDSFKLDVSGTGRFTGKLTISNTASNNFQSNRNSTNAQYQTWYEADGTTRRGYFGYGEGGNNNFYFQNEQSGSIYIGTNNAINLTIANSGAATFSSSVTAGGSINATTSVNGASVNTLGTQSTFRITSNYAGSGDIPAGTLMYLDDNTYTNLGIIPSSSGTAGSKIAAVAFNGSAWRSMWEFANVSSGNPNLLLVKNGGNVGIGTTSPGTTLQVDASKSNTTTSAPFNSDILRLNNTNATTNALHGILLTRTNGASLTSVGAIMSQVTTQTVGNAAADLLFYTAVSDVISERMRITSGGNVGIGLTNPDAKLFVKGTGGAQLIIDYQGAPTNYYDADTHIFRSYSGNTYPERMRITSGGDVGIGNTGDASVKLFVTGKDTSSNNYAALLRNSSGSNLLGVKNNGVINMGSLPTSSTGLSTGDLWNDSGTLKIV